MKFQLLLNLALTTLLTLISGLPTTSANAEANLDSHSPLTKRATLRCHSGLPASVCQDQYGASCDMSGEIFTPSYPEDGESCTSRNCFCSRW